MKGERRPHAQRSQPKADNATLPPKRRTLDTDTLWQNAYRHIAQVSDADCRKLGSDHILLRIIVRAVNFYREYLNSPNKTRCAHFRARALDELCLASKRIAVLGIETPCEHLDKHPAETKRERDARAKQQALLELISQQ